MVIQQAGQALHAARQTASDAVRVKAEQMIAMAVVAPRLAHLGLLDFHRAREAIDAEERAAEASLPFLRELGLGKQFIRPSRN